jgi:hypothetical protein
MLIASILTVQELSHCYEHMPFESKLDSHIYAIVLLYCLKHSYGTMVSINGISISQVIFALFFGVCGRVYLYNNITIVS